MVSDFSEFNSWASPERTFSVLIVAAMIKSNGENPMKKFLITSAALALMCGSALAQTSTGPAPQGDNMTKPGMTTGTMEKGSMDKGTMSDTTGMNKGDPKKEMSKDGSPAAGSKDNMKK
jgi:hypothetical protein